MSEPIWTKFLTERDKAVFAAAGYGACGGFGKRPALLVIDVNYAFCGDKPEPIVESIKKWRTSCGEDAWEAMPYLRALIDKCHEKGLPVLYTTGVRRDDNWDGGSWLWKNNRGAERPKTAVTNIDGNEIMAEIAPGPQDIVIHKQKPSGFFGTNLASYLQLLGADSVIVTGPRRPAASVPRCSTPSASTSGWRWRRRPASTARRRATPSTCATCTPSTPTC